MTAKHTPKKTSSIKKMKKKPEMVPGVYPYACSTKKVRLLLIYDPSDTPSDKSLLKTAAEQVI